MFEYGIGVRRDGQAAFKCLKESAARGNVYAQGNLAVHYFRRKLFNKAANVAKRYWTNFSNLTWKITATVPMREILEKNSVGIRSPCEK